MKIKADVDWTAVARDYAVAGYSIADVCARHGVSRSAFYRRKKTWDIRTDAAPTKPAPPQPKLSRNLLKRLTQALDDKMTKFEERLQCAEPQSSADHEREARTLHSLLRMFERVSELSEDARRARSATETVAKGIDADADALRRQLAARLDKLRGGERR